MIIEYEECYKKWVVFKVKRSLKTEIFRNKYKKECKEYVKNKKATKKEENKNGNKRIGSRKLS